MLRFPAFGPSLFSLLFVLSFASGALADTIDGRVIDPDGRPVAGAHVLLTAPATLSRTVITGEDGTYTFGRLPAGRYDLHVALEGFRAEPASVTLAPGERRTVPLRLRLAAVAESIVVSAAQSEQPLSRTAPAVTVIGAAELRARQTETVAQALRAVPGLAVTQSGGRGALTSLFPRGGESNYTLVLVDGIRLNSFGGDYDFAHLPVAEVDRIEVVRGPQSAVFGADAIGGVVHVISRHGGAPRAEVVAEAGSLRTTRLAAASAGTRGPWSWGAAAERLASDGFTGVARASGERVTNDDYENRVASFSGSWGHGSGARVRGTARIGVNERGFPGPYGSDPAGLFGGVDPISRGETLARAWSLGATLPQGRLRHHAQVSQHVSEGDFISPFGPFESSSRRLAARVQSDAGWRSGLGLSTGLELLRERAGSTFITGPAFGPVPVHRQVVGYFGEARYAPAGRWSAAAGLRVEQIRRDALAGDPSPFNPRPAFVAGTIFSANPKIAATWFVRAVDVAGWTRLHGSAGTGIRPPDAFEIAFTDNPMLKPERSRSVDLGVEHAVAGGAIVFDATAFANRYEDLIVAVGGGFEGVSRYRTDNISNARARGLELTAAGRTAAGLHVSASYTWLATRILAVDRADAAPPPFVVGDPLIRRPRHQLFIVGTFARGSFSAFGEIGARGGALDIEPNFGTFGGLFVNPGYGMANGGAGLALGRRTELFLRVSNLFDRRYEETLGFPAPRRGAMAGVRVAARR